MLCSTLSFGSIFLFLKNLCWNSSITQENLSITNVSRRFCHFTITIRIKLNSLSHWHCKLFNSNGFLIIKWEWSSFCWMFLKLCSTRSVARKRIECYHTDLYGITQKKTKLQSERGKSINIHPKKRIEWAVLRMEYMLDDGFKWGERANRIKLTAKKLHFASQNEWRDRRILCRHSHTQRINELHVSFFIHFQLCHSSIHNATEQTCKNEANVE